MRCGYICRIIIKFECDCRVNPCPKVKVYEWAKDSGGNVDRTGEWEGRQNIDIWPDGQ
jgi:hypothetical protein